MLPTIAVLLTSLFVSAILLFRTESHFCPLGLALLLEVCVFLLRGALVIIACCVLTVAALVWNVHGELSRPAGNLHK